MITFGLVEPKCILLEHVTLTPTSVEARYLELEGHTLQSSSSSSSGTKMSCSSSSAAKFLLIWVPTYKKGTTTRAIRKRPSGVCSPVSYPIKTKLVHVTPLDHVMCEWKPFDKRAITSLTLFTNTPHFIYQKHVPSWVWAEWLRTMWSRLSGMVSQYSVCYDTLAAGRGRFWEPSVWTSSREPTPWWQLDAVTMRKSKVRL